MLTKLENSKYTLRIEPSDWRFSATIIGLCSYLDYYNIDYILEEEYLEFNENDIKTEKYLLFAESHFKEAMHHIIIENLLEFKEENNEKENERIKKINERLKANTIMKNIFKIKYDGSNDNEIKKLINENRLELIKNTFKSGKSLYYNFCNENMLFKEAGKICRINGYSIDTGRKSKAAAYRMDNLSLTTTDTIYFDFIPFAFSKSREAFFINANYNLKELKRLVSNINFKSDNSSSDPLRTDMLLNTKENFYLIEFDVEVITKDREKGFFKTLFIRKEAINILKKISENTKRAIQIPCKIKKGNSFSNNEYIPIQKIIIDRILNFINIDDLIEFLFKEENKFYLIKNLIKVNRLIYKEEDNMDELHKKAIMDAMAIKRKLESKSNKLRAYEQRLISAISLKDYDKVKELLLHLSSYTQTPITIMIPLFEDFEKNKNLAYTFISALGDKNYNKEEK